MTRSLIAIAALINLLTANPVAAAAGDLDTSFGSGGKVITAGGPIFSVAIQSDGKIVGAGSGNNGTNLDFMLLRYNSNGTLDDSFGVGGKVSTPINDDNDQAVDLAIQSDGKIVAAGNSEDGSGDDQFALVRYNTDGTLDTSFGSGGKVSTNVGVGDDIALSVAIQSDGKVVAAGYSKSDGNLSNISLVRYNADGSQDATAGFFGMKVTDISDRDRANSVVIQSDGKILVGGSSASAGASGVLVRYSTNLSLDASFGLGGIVITPVSSVDSVAIQSDGKIVAAGYKSNGIYNDFALMRYNSNGTLDSDFGAGGEVITSFGSNAVAQSVAIQSDGKIVAVGSSGGGFANDFALVRYNTDGTLDTSFGSAGKVTTAFSGGDQADSVAIQSDGKIVAAGYILDVSSSSALARYVASSPPATPSAPTATYGDGQATVTWTKPVDNGSPITGYTVTSSGGQTCTTNNADTLTCIVTGLTNGTAYTFTVTATNGEGTSASSPASDSITLVAPAVPVPTLPLFGLGILVNLLGLFGYGRLKHQYFSST